MTIIRKLSIFDKPKIKNMLSFLQNDDAERFLKVLTNTSYVLTDENEFLGIISAAKISGNPHRIKITRLLFNKDYYDIGKQLVEYIIARYGAKGAQSFTATIDESHDELTHLFIDGCGFRRCSCEELWRVSNFHFKHSRANHFRPFKNADAQAAADMFNNSVIAHFKPSLVKEKAEYKAPLLKGCFGGYNLQYIMTDAISGAATAYFSINTFDNTNYILDIVENSGFEVNYDEIIGFAQSEIARRRSKYYLFAKVKKYCYNAGNFEKYLLERDFSCVQTQLILVKDFYRVVKEPAKPISMVLFNPTSV